MYLALLWLLLAEETATLALRCRLVEGAGCALRALLTASTEGIEAAEWRMGRWSASALRRKWVLRRV